MDKAAIVVLADTETHGELGRLVNALSTADEFKEHGDEVTIICNHRTMRVIASEAATDFIHQQGGRVYVWLKTSRCCGAATTLASALEPPKQKQFKRAEGSQRFDLYLDARLSHLPDELHVDLRRFPRRLEAYWNGCVWVI